MRYSRADGVVGLDLNGIVSVQQQVSWISSDWPRRRWNQRDEDEKLDQSVGWHQVMICFSHQLSDRPAR
jgi:hypothetical protein